jgi:hypothetical protein
MKFFNISAKEPLTDLHTITKFVLETDKLRQYNTPLSEVSRNLKSQLACGVNPNTRD